MRNVDGDHRHARLVIARRDGRRDRLVGLELDHQIDARANQLLGVAERDLRLIAVVDDDQLDLLAFGGAQQALVDFAREGAVLLALRGIADAIALAAADFGGQAIAVRVDLLDQAAIVQRVEQAEAHPLGEAGAIHHVAQAERFAGRLERAQDLGGVDQRLHQIGVAARPRLQRVERGASSAPPTCRGVQRVWRLVGIHGVLHSVTHVAGGAGHDNVT